MRQLDETSFKNRNAASYWYRTRNPIRVLMNGLLMMLAKYFPSMMVKRNVFRLMGAKIGKDVVIAPSTLDPIFPELIEIGDNSIIGWDVMILTHEFVGNKLRKGRVKIGKNTTIGARTLIMPGITIGDNVIIAADSLVNKDVANEKVEGGVPIEEISVHLKS